MKESLTVEINPRISQPTECVFYSFAFAYHHTYVCRYFCGFGGCRAYEDGNGDNKLH